MTKSPVTSWSVATKIAISERTLSVAASSTFLATSTQDTSGALTGS